MGLKVSLLFVILGVVFASCNRAKERLLPAVNVIPDSLQVLYQQQELVGFIHFGMNTYTDKEWGYGDEDPSLFNPEEFDAGQWARIAAESGIKELILTAKHHDGFCLWPSKYTEHSIKNSRWRNGNGDVVGEFVKACHTYGLRVGLYLSPWDRNHATYGTQAYIDYYLSQLSELLSDYGTIDELWLDGANGGDGYYGGARETRTIDRDTYYPWDSIYALARHLQPDILIFSDAGPDIRWIGNEQGWAGETCWSMLNTLDVTVGAADTHYLNEGDPEGTDWVVGQCDVSIRPGWFYHADQDSLVRTPDNLYDLYLKSVGRNAVLLLNLPPAPNGLIASPDEASLMGFRTILDSVFRHNLATEARLSCTPSASALGNAAPDNLRDAAMDRYWLMDKEALPSSILYQFKEPVDIHLIVLQEPVHLGQRISDFTIEGMSDGKWVNLAGGTTIGYKRMVSLPETKVTKVRININKALSSPALSYVAIY